MPTATILGYIEYRVFVVSLKYQIKGADVVSKRNSSLALLSAVGRYFDFAKYFKNMEYMFDYGKNTISGRHKKNFISKKFEGKKYIVHELNQPKKKAKELKAKTLAYS